MRTNLFSLPLITPEECAYAAGIFDGEGTTYICRCVATWRGSNEIYFRTTVNVANTFIPVLHWFKERWLGSVHVYNYGVRPIGHWNLTGRVRVTAFLQALRPYLQIKAEKADMMMRLAKLQESSNRWHPGRQESRNLQAALYEEWYRRWPREPGKKRKLFA